MLSQGVHERMINVHYYSAGYGCYSQCAVRNGPGRICLIQLPASDSVPFFQRRHGSRCAKPTRIPSGWPGQVLAKRIWSESKPVCRNHRARFLAGCNRPCYQFPTFSLGSVLPHTSRIITVTVQNRPGSDLVPADCVRFWPNRSGPEVSRCARIIRSGSGQRLRAGPDRMQIGSGISTGPRPVHSVDTNVRMYRYRRSRCWQAGEKRAA